MNHNQLIGLSGVMGQGPQRPAEQAEAPAPTAIRPAAYLRSVLALAWGALRYPTRTTVVDLSTGEAFHLPSGGA